MAWQCSGSTNTELIRNMYQSGIITNTRVMNAMLKVDREHYAPSRPYEDAPQPIGWGATISAPHMHASAAEALVPFLRQGARVLDIGSGSGYLTAVLAELVLDQKNDNYTNDSDDKNIAQTKIVGVEHMVQLRDLGEKNFKKSNRGKELISAGLVRFVLADGRRGWHEDSQNDASKASGWDAIHVGAAAKELHEELIDQLKCPGRLFIPVEDSKTKGQWIWQVDKGLDGSLTKVRREPVRYVPLTEAPFTTNI
ncbi:Protein-L-isoaspartate O-methyltransferase [Erysiphe neolycopersici]|uniref:protein-L-isoaspartate(D-aspartate) O-methyltransferase n=1 Tax=Erysiphe neolycopersici TaxID=212602 RepID=A0A420HSF5_9PEZI|nr:Protein-L-isoaspartate O-methyltransferase [Erysiphe neolycopersici]